MSMDFAAMGTMMGAESAIANVVSRARAVISEREGAIEERDVAIAQRDERIDEYRSALLVSYARDAALLAEVRTLKAALQKADPANSLLRKTGRRYKSGAEESALSLVFDVNFDQAILKSGLDKPERYRDAV